MNSGARSATRCGLLAGVCAMLAACGGNGESADPASAPAEAVLHVYNWADYIGPTTIADFETQTGIRVTYDTYDSNEVLETRLLTGRSGYDVVFPTATVLARMARVGVFLELDKDQLPNLANMDPEVTRQLAAYDPGNRYAISYMWGTTGIGYNPAMVEKVLGTDMIDSWGAVFDPASASRLARCGITMLDAPEDVFESAEIYLGTDPGNEDLQEMAATEAVLARARPHVRSFDSNQHLNALASGDICVALSWNNLMQQARERGAAATRPVALRYVIPREGAPLWFDTVAIPADAPHSANAHRFLDYLMQPEVIATITNHIGTANGNAASLPFVAASLREDPSVYPGADVRDRLHVSQERSQQYSRELNRAWTRVKTGQ